MNVKLFIFSVFLILLKPLHAQKIQIGVRTYYPPFEMMIDQQKQFSGFDVDLMTEICNRMQVECIFKPFPLDALFKNIQTGNISLAIGALILTQERQQNFLFSLPYMMSHGQFVTLKSNKINKISDICDKKIAVIKSSIYRLIAADKCSNKIQFVEYLMAPDVYPALISQDVTAFITDEKAAKYWVTNNDQFKLLGNPIPTGTGYAIMANKNQNTLVDAINKALLSMENDGTYLKIYATYF